jgi:AraC-like DNA-binding protein
MGYSRTAFYLKVKRLTGTAPNDMVLGYRFKAAAEAIRNTRTSLSDIAEKTGFGSYSYFSKAFKKHFGVSPKDYRQQE